MLRVSDRLTLYQFAGSHFCEKARWALDYKGLEYSRRTLVPGPHRRVTLKLAPKPEVPILCDDERVIQGSGTIIDYLERKVPRPPLTPTTSFEASAASEWEGYLDRNVGVPLGLYFYHGALEDRRLATDFLLQDAPWWGRPLYAVIFPQVARAMRRGMGINEESAQAARETLLAAFDRLDGQLAEHRFLAGPHFSRADLTAGALLERLCVSTDPSPPPIWTLRDECRDRPFFRWVQILWRDYRSGPR
jgi:glutathione S-transferase